MGEHDHRPRQQRHLAGTHDTGTAPGKGTLVSGSEPQAGAPQYRGSVFTGAKTPWATPEPADPLQRDHGVARIDLGATREGDATGGPRTASVAEQERIRGSLDVVTQSFHWLDEASQQRLEQLRRDLKTEDEPDWSTELAEAVLEVGISSGAMAAGTFIAEKLVHGAGEVTKNFVEALFTDGTKAGVNAGLAKLSGGKDDHVIDPFVDAQKEGIWGTQMENQADWLKKQRSKVQSVDEAEKLEQACSRDHVKAAAEKQYQASRDAWVSYLAQKRFGSVGEHGPVTKDSIEVGPTRTDMSTQAQRDRDAKGTAGYRDATDAPDYADSARGDAAGVLEVVASLPKITQAVSGVDLTNVMDGAPTVTIAILNGTNDRIRDQYAGTALADLRIPRQIHAQVDGAPDFTLNLDEQGNSNVLWKQRATWLRLRATVNHPENATLTDHEKENKGRELLLSELVPDVIFKRGV